MPVPLPTSDEANLELPDQTEVLRCAAGVLSATRVGGFNTEFQKLLIAATFEAMTGHSIESSLLPFIDAATNGENLRYRTAMFRMRMVHMMVLSALVLRPLPPEVAASVNAYSRELGIDDNLLRTVEQFASSNAAIAAIDFERNGYTADWTTAQSASMHTSLSTGWAVANHDVDLAARWMALGGLAEGTLGRRLHDFYRARGFSFPGSPGSAPPLLAQHDWVHVLADFGTTVEAELEVFAFIARANDNPKGFSLLAMVVSLFETGYLQAGAGLFEAFPGQLSHSGMTLRIGDAMRRGALSHGPDGEPDVDFMQVDWFRFADMAVESVRERFGVVPKPPRAIDAGSATPWQPGGISPFQVKSGQQLAEASGVPYESYGASVL